MAELPSGTVRIPDPAEVLSVTGAPTNGQVPTYDSVLKGTKWAAGGSGGSETLAQVLANGNDANALQIVNLQDPSVAQAAATKHYVDAADALLTPQTRTITAGAGLTGGGSLAANRTLAVLGVAAATDGQVFTADGAGSATWNNPNEVNLATLGMSTSNTAAQNSTILNAAIAAMTVGGTLYLPGANVPYPCNQIVLPRIPITLRGDGPSASIFQAPVGFNTSLLTYDNTLGSPTSGGFSPDGFTGSDPVAGIPYRGNQWLVKNLGFTKIDDAGSGSSAQKGWNFPQWDSGVPTDHRITLWAENCMVSSMWGTGIDYKINGCVNDSEFSNIFVFNNEGIGVDFGSDSHWDRLVVAFSGYEGGVINGKCPTVSNSKFYSNGSSLNWARAIGLYITGDQAAVLLDTIYLQDNFAEGLVVENGAKVCVAVLAADRNCAHTVTTCGVRITDSHDVSITDYTATDSSGWTRVNPTGAQIHAVLVQDSTGSLSYDNRIELTQATTEGDDGNTATLGPPVDPASVLFGTDVQVGAGDSVGQISVAVTTNVLGAVDPYKGSSVIVVPGANITTVGAPTNKHRGARLRYTFLPSGTFNVTGWDAVFKGSTVIPTTGGASTKMLIVDFESDGTNWYLSTTAPAWVTK